MIRLYSVRAFIWCPVTRGAGYRGLLQLGQVCRLTVRLGIARVDWLRRERIFHQTTRLIDMSRSVCWVHQFEHVWADPLQEQKARYEMGRLSPAASLEGRLWHQLRTLHSGHCHGN